MFVHSLICVVFNATVLGIYNVGLVVQELEDVVNVNLYHLLHTNGVANVPADWIILPAQVECVYVARLVTKTKSQVADQDVQDVNAQLVRHSVHSVTHRTFNAQLFSIFISSEYQPDAIWNAHFILVAMFACAFIVTHCTQSMNLLAVSQALQLHLLLVEFCTGVLAVAAEELSDIKDSLVSKVHAPACVFVLAPLLAMVVAQ